MSNGLLSLVVLPERVAAYQLGDELLEVQAGLLIYRRPRHGGCCVVKVLEFF